MKGIVPPDPVGGISQQHYAVVYVPGRSRKRFSANCVTLYSTEEEAISASNPDKKYFAAKVLGPSKSSEGQILYYLTTWL